jgi:hypothetical protein
MSSIQNFNVINSESVPYIVIILKYYYNYYVIKIAVLYVLVTHKSKVFQINH